MGDTQACHNERQKMQRLLVDRALLGTPGGKPRLDFRNSRSISTLDAFLLVAFAYNPTASARKNNQEDT
jgi:hypothetical protein